MNAQVAEVVGREACLEWVEGAVSIIGDEVVIASEGTPTLLICLSRDAALALAGRLRLLAEALPAGGGD